MLITFNLRACSTRLLAFALLLTGFALHAPASYAIGCASPSFGTATTFNIPSNVYDIAVADYNRDGKLDVATANRNVNTVSIILGNGMGGFGAPTSLSVGNGPTGIATGDFNRDGKADLVTANNAGNSISILLGNGTGGFSATTIPLGAGFEPWSVLVAEFNADDVPDLAVNGNGNGGKILLGNGGGGFVMLAGIPPGGVRLAAADFNEDGILDLPVATGLSIRMLWGDGAGGLYPGPLYDVGIVTTSFVKGDFNGDGKLDLAVSNMNVSPTKVVVLLNNGQSGFLPATAYDLNTPSGSTALFAADLNFDGRTDIASSIYIPGMNNGAVTILTGDGLGAFSPAQQTDFVRAPQTVVAADLNRDGRLDLLTGDLGPGFGGGTVTVMLNTCPENPVRRNRIADFDGDGLTDISVYRPHGTWYETRSSSNAFFARPGFGMNGDILVPGDFDGDRKSDIAVFRPSTGEWFTIDSSDGLYKERQWGTTGDIPAIGDYDGDGKSDLAVFRPTDGAWYIKQSSDFTLRVQAWGASGDVPVSGDFDGDGKSDIAVFRPAEGAWYLLHSADGSFRTVQWGTGTDKLVPGDYDGDAKTDVAVYRPGDGAWYVLRSSDNSMSVQAWGNSTDVPAPGDYDGDGKTDFAIYRAGIWYVLNSSTSTIQVSYFGLTSDVPLPSAYTAN